LSEPEVKKASNLLQLVVLVCVLLAYAVGIGYNLNQVADNTRRVNNCESGINALVSFKADKTDVVHKDDEVTRRLERIEEKVDRLQAYQVRHDPR
jgi:hypothetical protein